MTGLMQHLNGIARENVVFTSTTVSVSDHVIILFFVSLPLPPSPVNGSTGSLFVKYYECYDHNTAFIS